MPSGKLFRQEARAADRQQRKWANRLERDFRRRQPPLVVPQAHEDHLNQQGLRAAGAQPAAPLNPAQVQLQPVFVPDPPMPVPVQAQVPVPVAVPVPVPTATLQPPILPTAHLPATPQLRINVNAAEFVPAHVKAERLHDEAEFTKQVDYVNNLIAETANLDQRSANLNLRAVELASSAASEKQHFENLRKWFWNFGNVCQNTNLQLRACLTEINRLVAPRAHAAEAIVGRVLYENGSYWDWLQYFDQSSNLIVDGEAARVFNNTYPRLRLTTTEFVFYRGPAFALTESQLTVINTKLAGHYVTQWREEGLPATRHPNLRIPLQGRVLIPKKVFNFPYELSGEIFCDWIAASQDHAPSIADMVTLFAWAIKNPDPEIAKWNKSNPQSPLLTGFWEEVRDNGNISLSHRNITFRFVLSPNRRTLITAYK